MTQLKYRNVIAKDNEDGDPMYLGTGNGINLKWVPSPLKAVPFLSAADANYFYNKLTDIWPEEFSGVVWYRRIALGGEA